MLHYHMPEYENIWTRGVQYFRHTTLAYRMIVRQIAEAEDELKITVAKDHLPPSLGRDPAGRIKQNRVDSIIAVKSN